MWQLLSWNALNSILESVIFQKSHREHTPNPLEMAFKGPLFPVFVGLFATGILDSSQMLDMDSDAAAWQF